MANGAHDGGTKDPGVPGYLSASAQWREFLVVLNLLFIIYNFW